MSIIYVDASALDDADRARVAAAIFAAVERPGLALIEEDVRALLDARNENEALRAQNVELLGALRKTRDAWCEEASWGDGIAEEHSIILADTDAILTRADGEEPAFTPAIAKAKGGAE